MGKIKYILTIVFILLAGSIKAQVSTMQVADSTSTGLYNSGDWKELIVFGNQTVKSGIDFPGLRLKIAYAYMMSGNFKLALKNYDDILANDSYNETARFYAYLCNSYLNNDLAASYNAGYMQNRNGLNSFAFIAAGAEFSTKENDDINRGDASYSRISLSNRLSWRWQLEQSLAYYYQTIFRLSNSKNNSIDEADQQKEYYAKLSYAASAHFSILGAYHYVNTNFKTSVDNSNLGFIGARFTAPYFDLQVDMNFGNLDKKPIEQYNGKFTFYPTGNFNFYTISRVSDQHLNASDHIILSQAIGFKLIKNTWLESSVTIGNQDDYLDADGLYIYNAIDKTTFKCGETLFYQLSRHMQLQLNYVYEKKDDSYQSLNYDQNSITLGLIWKF